MDETKAEKLARRLMDKHGLSHWEFRFDNAKRRAGCCWHVLKRISLSRNLIRIRSDDNIKNTILHEIAHALVGPGHGHDEVWRRKAIEIGCDGKRCYTDAKLDGRWVAVCTHGKTFFKHKRPPSGALYACKCEPSNKIYNLKFQLNENIT